mgnify:FL=1|tara:strand:+ start:574 stop:1224 length:651 start_codon:yes stop_codon:yes gene_type:complete
MDELKTPRKEIKDEDIEFWSDEIEELLSEWGEIALCYGWLYNYSERKYKKKYHHMSIPIIVLSTLTGTANFADSYVPIGFKQGFSACVGGLNILCGILGTLMSFLKYAEIYESSRISSVAWSKFGRNIQIELALKDGKRKNCRDFLKVSRSEYDRLLESSPNIDQDIINTFNKKFKNDYSGKVAFPIVCNGLKEVKIYKDKIKMPTIINHKIRQIV